MSGRVSRFIPEWLIGALCLAVPGLYNGFPLVNPDTGAYIENAYQLYVPLDRPLGYSVFLRLGLMDVSLWIPVLIQCLVISGLLLAVAHFLLGAVYTRGRAVLAMLILGIFSSVGWFTGQLSPDIFSAVLVLSALCLVLIPMKRLWRWLLYAIVLLTILCHNSNLLISGGAGVLLLLAGIKTRNLRRPGAELLTMALVGFLTLCTLNAIAERGFRPSAGSHVFLVSRMVETGMMEEYLQDYCAVDTPRYRLCDWQGRLPDRQWDFMWGEQSPLQAAGGWLAVEPEYKRIVRNTLTRPKYIGLHLKYALTGTVQQLPLLQAGDGIFRFGSGTSPYDRISWYEHAQLDALKRSRQNSEKGLRLDTWNPFMIGCELLLLVIPLFLRRKSGVPATAFRRALWTTILLLLVNAAVTATFATVVARYESRVIWILPFLSILYILHWLHFRRVKRSAQP
jgi:hypothetical protein